MRTASQSARSPKRTEAEPEGVHELVTAVLLASRVLVGVSARSLADVEDNVTVTQFRTLVVLDSHGGINLNTLAALLDVTPSTALRMIDRLLIAELVTRQDNPANRREVLLALTKQGKRIVDRVTTSRRREITRIVTAMPDIQRADLITALRAFAEAAGEPDPEPSATVGTDLGW
jgi:DNA-binding MarR family transcriptional regulator